MRLLTNFSAGPAALPTEVITRLTDQFGDYKGSGYSIAECSHRSALYHELHVETIEKIKRVLAIPSEYEVLLLGGGATLQFAMLSFNFSGADGGDYCITGAWGEKAYQSARATQNQNSATAPRVAYSGASHSYTRLPSWAEVSQRRNAEYLHITSNETIHGVQFKRWPAIDIRVPLIIDMSSDIMTKPLPVSRFSMIYASAQKNIGIAGVTVVIIRKSFLDRAIHTLPPYMSYRTHAAAHSLYNTPPTLSIFSVNLVMDWITEQGGLIQLNARNLAKAGMLYSYLDDHGDFYRNTISPADRSTVNIVCTLPTEALTARFLAFAKERHIVGINGHRSVGGCRISLYNAIELRGVEMLIECMERFRKNAPHH